MSNLARVYIFHGPHENRTEGSRAVQSEIAVNAITWYLKKYLLTLSCNKSYLLKSQDIDTEVSNNNYSVSMIVDH